MILRALVDLADREGIDPLWPLAEVRYAIELDGAGKYLGVTTLGDEKRGLRMQVPLEPSGRTGSVLPGFLVDNHRYVLGIAKPEEKPKEAEKALARAREYYDAFHALMVRADALCPNGTLAPVVAFLAARSPVVHGDANDEIAAGREWSGSERVAFRVEGAFVHNLPEARAAFGHLMAPTVTDDADLMTCLVTGERGPAARLHPKIKRVPTAQTAGASLVSFNSSVFESHGRKQGDNAGVSEGAARKYGAALNWLLDGDVGRRFRRGVLLGDDAAILVWAKDSTEEESLLVELLAPSATDEDAPAPGTAAGVISALESPWKGMEPGPLDHTAFYALTVAGNAARVVVRDWFETTLGAAKDNLRRFFEDLRIAGAKDAPFPITQLLRCLQATPDAAQDKRGASSTLASRLFRAALLGYPFPMEVLALALRRMRVPPARTDGAHVLRNRVALVKACLRRLPTPQEVTVSLDESNTTPAYVSGRLFATLERLQQVALGSELNATIRDRYFGAASSTPAVVFPRLLRLSVHHASKAAEQGRYLERTKSKVMGLLPASGFPSTLGLVEQGLFAVGYYHQREAFFAPRPKADSGRDGEPSPDASE